jgi:hypothetical protein
MDKDLSDEEFIKYFTKKYKALMKSIARRYLIPNRYTVDDILQYIAERITTILYNRQSGDNKILDREKYFLNCLVFYCVEYQRMNGFIFCLPKRPRNNAREDELAAKSKDFSYINDIMLDDPTLIYESNFCYDEVEVDQEANPTWSTLTGMLPHSEDAAVVDCIFRRNMTLLETSQYLGVAQSTCLNRRNRAIKNLYHAFDNMSGEIKENIKEMLRDGFSR